MAVLRFLLLATILSAATAAKYLLEASASTGDMRRELASKKASKKKSKAPLSKAKGSKTSLNKTTERKTRGSKTSSLRETDTAVPMLMSNQGKIMDILIDFKLATASQVPYQRYRRYDLHGPCMQDLSMHHETSRYGRDMPDPGIYILLHASRCNL